MARPGDSDETDGAVTDGASEAGIPNEMAVTLALDWLSRVERVAEYELRRLASSRPTTAARKERDRRAHLRAVVTRQQARNARSSIREGRYDLAMYRIMVIAASGIMAGHAENALRAIDDGARGGTDAPGAHRDQVLLEEYDAECARAVASGKRKPPYKTLAAAHGMKPDAYRKALARARKRAT